MNSLGIDKEPIQIGLHNNKFFFITSRNAVSQLAWFTCVRFIEEITGEIHHNESLTT